MSSSSSIAPTPSSSDSKCATCSLPHGSDVNRVADALGVSPQYRQDDAARWNCAAHAYKTILHQHAKSPASPPPSPEPAFEDPIGHERIQSSLSNLSSPNRSRTPHGSLIHCSTEHHRPVVITNDHCPNCMPSFGSSIHCSVEHHRPVVITNDHCPNCMPSFGSLPFSLNKVSSRNRSNAGTCPQSRGESSLELEAIAAVHELSFAVESISVSEILPRTLDLIFVNVTTVEELTMKGWRVTSLRQDCMQGDFTRLDLFTKYYDSLYALMDSISPGYRDRFGEKLAQRLRMLQAGDEEGLVAPTSSYAPSPAVDSNEAGLSSRISSTGSLPVVTPRSSPQATPLVGQLDEGPRFI